MKNTLVAGVDIGGSHITVCLVDMNKAVLLYDTLIREHVDTGATADVIIASWADAVRKCFQRAGTESAHLGIAMPGPFDYETGISYIKGLHKYERLFQLNVKALLGEALGIPASNIRMMNDAAAFLLGEMRCGCATGRRNVAGVTLGTGLGSASCTDNVHVEEKNLFCMPYRNGTAEDYISSRWFVKSYEQMTNKKVSGVKEIAAAVEHDKMAKELFETFGQALGEVLIQKFAAQSPEMIVVGGNIAQAWEHFIPATNAVMKQHGYSIPLKRSLLGEEAALAGASYTWAEADH